MNLQCGVLGPHKKRNKRDGLHGTRSCHIANQREEIHNLANHIYKCLNTEGGSNSCDNPCTFISIYTPLSTCCPNKHRVRARKYHPMHSLCSPTNGGRDPCTLRNSTFCLHHSPQWHCMPCSCRRRARRLCLIRSQSLCRKLRGCSQEWARSYPRCHSVHRGYTHNTPSTECSPSSAAG